MRRAGLHRSPTKPRARRVAIDTPPNIPADLTELAARFTKDCAPLIGPDGRMGLAVSGGPDSLALLVLASRAFPDRIEVATVDHGLRTASATEAEMVAELCAQLGVPHQTLRVDVADGNLQAEARKARYAALGDWAEQQGLSAIATAHHRDDIVETLLMRLNRGAGLKGLAAMRAARPLSAKATLIRPLLCWQRSELAEVCDAAGLKPAQDPSNNDTRFARVLIRKALLAQDWLDSERLAASAAHLREDAEALDQLAKAEWDRCVTLRPGGPGSYSPKGPRAIRFRVLESLLLHLGTSQTPPRGPDLARLLDTLESGGVGTLSGLRAASKTGSDGPEWLFTPEPPRKSG